MIFIIIGIIILFVSFFIALTSLIREQNKLDPDRKKVNYDNIVSPLGDIKKETHTSHEEASENTVQNDRIQDPVIVSDRSQKRLKEVNSREAFPWEQKYSDNQLESEGAQEEQISKIQAELKKLKSEPIQNERESHKNESIPTQQMPKSGSISGEFSLSDYRKKINRG